MIVHDFYLISYFIIVHILVLQALFDLDNNLTMVSSDSTVYISLWFIQSKQNFVWENGQVLAALAGLNFQVQI